MRVTIVGIGDIGTHLAEPLARFISFLPGEHTLTLVDGDAFEDRNKDRQTFDTPGNKAQSWAEKLACLFPSLKVEAVPEFLSPDNADFILLEGEMVLLCVDNHKTRKLVSDVAGALSDISVISGGNELTDGDVLVYLRRDHQDTTPSFTAFHPEIENPTEKAPYEMGCEELAKAGSPQLLPTNFMAASLMLNAFWRLTMDEEKFISDRRGEDAFVHDTAYSEVAFDIYLNRTRGRKFGTNDSASLDQQPVEKERVQ